MKRILLAILFSGMTTAQAQAPFSGGEGSGYASAKAVNVVLSSKDGNMAPFSGIFPNPLKSGEILHLQFTGKARVEVYSTDGKLVAHQQLSGNNNEMRLNLLPGIYILRLKNHQFSHNLKLLVYE